jgi:uncharacterized protein YecA (UPF0149 family)
LSSASSQARQASASARTASASNGRPACVAELYELTLPLRYKVDAVRRASPKVGRNEPCPCGSGRKFKHCHGAAAPS